jgi:signal transduction histidine kinase/CheY-like chemotaxis protein
MHNKLPSFNLSINKALATEPDNFIKARIRIIFTILIFSILKAAIAVIVAYSAVQNMQLGRAVIGLVLYACLIKMLLWMPRYAKAIAHTMLCAGILLIFTNLFFYAHRINLVTLQFIFMIMVSGFYTISSRAGLAYSIIAVIPVVIFLLTGDNVDMYSRNLPQELASPGAEIIAILNFATIIIAHYLFLRAFQGNIVEKEELNVQLQQAADDANQLAVSRSNFLSTMSHELRTPLNAVIGTAELLIKDKPEEKQEENLKILHSSALDLLSLINNVLDFNKIDSEMLQLEKVPVKLSDLVQNVCAALRIRANGKGLKFTLEIDEQLKAIYVSTDPTRLSQILYNLVGNAIKFTETGSVYVKLYCADTKAGNIKVQFSVSDTGVGISRDKYDTIFDLFVQGDANVSRKYGGTGLGLPIVKQLLLLFGSKIELDSTPGKGSRFYFTLPLHVVQDPTTETNMQEQKQEQPLDFSHLRILIAEDNEINRMIVKKQLATFNISPVIVEDGASAYETWLANHFDLVVLDLHMPISDGYETLQRMRAFNETPKANTHVIAFTASVNEREKIIAAGFNDVLYKPANIKDLREKLEMLM